VQEHELKAVIAAADDAINREDLDTLMDFYTDDATLVVMPGKVVTGKPQIRKAFDAIAAHFNHTVHVSPGEMIVFEGGDTALVLSNTHVRANQGTDSELNVDRRATYIFKKFPDGKWRCVIDNSYGTDLLPPAQTA